MAYNVINIFNSSPTPFVFKISHQHLEYGRDKKWSTLVLPYFSCTICWWFIIFWSIFWAWNNHDIVEPMLKNRVRKDFFVKIPKVKPENPRFWMNKYEWFTALYLFDTRPLVFNHALLHINSDRLSLREKNWVLVLYI